MPEEDRYTLTREQILARIKHAMGGRAAEEVVFGHFSTGAANDLKQATDSARRMVCSYGMSERIGPVSLADDEADVFLGRDFVTRKDYSEKKMQEIDEEIARILRTLYDEAKQMLAENRGALDRISESLLERETLEGAELKLLIEGRTLPPLPSPVASKKEAHPERAKAETAQADPPRQAPRPGARSRLGVVPVQITAIFPAHRVTIVGILNATPDSFSDGGRFVRGEARLDLAAAVDAAAALVSAGAHVLDVGGESTRPGSQPVSPEIEIARTAPLIEAVAKRLDVPLSIDTRKAEVARAALDAGARIVNDVSGLRHDPALAARGGARRRDADPRAPARRAGDHAGATRTSTTCCARWATSWPARSRRRARRASPRTVWRSTPASASASASRTTSRCSPSSAGCASGSASRCWSAPRARASWAR